METTVITHLTNSRGLTLFANTRAINVNNISSSEDNTQSTEQEKESKEEE